MQICRFKEILLCYLSNRPFFLEFEVSNDSVVSELLKLSGGNTIRVYVNLDVFELKITDKDNIKELILVTNL